MPRSSCYCHGCAHPRQHSVDHEQGLQTRLSRVVLSPVHDTAPKVSAARLSPLAIAAIDQAAESRAGIRRSVHNGVTISVFYFSGDREKRHAYFCLLRLSDRLAFGASADRHRRYSARCTTRHNAITASTDSR
jgi:hypothetical protein